jgi:hypothetical protein
MNVRLKKLIGHMDVDRTAIGRSDRRRCPNGDNPVDLSTGYPQASMVVCGYQKLIGHVDVWLTDVQSTLHYQGGRDGKSYPQAG